MSVNRLIASFLVLCGVSLGNAGFGQQVVNFSLADLPEEMPFGHQVTVVVRAEISPGWHLYSMNVPEGGPIPTSISVIENETFVQSGDVEEPTPIPWFDQNFNMETNYFEDRADFQVPVWVKADATTGPKDLTIQIRFMACDDSSCLPPQTREISESVTVVEGERNASPPTSVSSDAARPSGDAASESGQAGSGGQPAQPAQPARSSEGGLPTGALAYIWFAMTMGALALLTPCVFPMIPITVSYFTKREASSRSRTIGEAGLYSLGIIATFTLLGFALTFLFGAGGINRLAANPLVNLAIATIFVVFALSLFGVLELQLPSSWLNAINRKSSQTSGILGILLMALTFSLTSFTCTVPFVGTVMVAALQGDLLWSLMGVTAFATVFSLPFFLLALFPSFLESLPKSGNWMNSVKIVMGFLELAAALKFLSNVDLVFQWEILTRPVFITVWLAIGIVMSIYLLGWFRFPHENAAETLGTSRVLFAILSVAITIYLFRGLFGFSLGELDAFLPPRDYGAVEATFRSSADISADGEERWLTDFQSALQEAERSGQPIFVDFTGYTCTNCRWMEANMFPLPEVRELFSEYILVRLYTDGTKPEHEWNRNFEQERFGTIALPFYALISPSNETIATFPGLTRNAEEFVEFLRKGVSEEGV